MSERKREDGAGGNFLMTGAPGPETVINGRKYLYFGGTGYFGLQGSPALIRAGIAAFKKYGMHGAASRTGFGDNPVLASVEKKLSAYFGTEDALYYASGYLNGLFMAQGLAGEFDVAFADESSHFSLLDGLHAGRKPVTLYRHRDTSDLAAKLKSALKRGRRPLVASDGVFPAFGAIAPVPELLKTIEPYKGLLCLDDAHAVGVLGAKGRGTCEHFGVKPSGRIVQSGTLSKAFGGYGGFIPGSAAFINRLRKTVGAYGGASCIPTPVAAGSAKGIDLVRLHPEWRQKLRTNVARARKGLRGLGLEVGDSPVPIIAWTLPSAAEMKKVQKALLERGIAIAYLRYAGAPASGLLRVSVFSAHSAAQIDRLISELGRVL